MVKYTPRWYIGWPGASPGQTKWGGQYEWGVGRDVHSQVRAESGDTERLNPRNTLGKKWGGHVHPSPARGNAPEGGMYPIFPIGVDACIWNFEAVTKDDAEATVHLGVTSFD